MRHTIITLIAVFFIFIFYKPVNADSKDIEATGVVISDSQIEMIIGTTEQLTARVQPDEATNKNIYWISGDEEVVTVQTRGASSAEIRAEGGGEAWVTVVTEDQNWRASCKVTVIVPVSRVYMRQAELNLNPGQEYQFEAFIEPGNATNQVLNWASSDNRIVGVDTKGLAEAYKPGTARIVARSDENDNIYAFCTVTVGGNEETGAETLDKAVEQELEQDVGLHEEEVEETFEASDEENQGIEVGLNHLLIGGGATIILLLSAITIITKRSR